MTQAVTAKWAIGLLLAGIAGAAFGAATYYDDELEAAAAEAGEALPYGRHLAELARDLVASPAASASSDGPKESPATTLDLGVRLDEPLETLRPQVDTVPYEPADIRLAQFQVPPAAAGPEKAPALQAPKRLTYQYSLGSESLVEHRRNRDLTKRLRDNSTIAVPEFNGILVYRPTDWLDMTVEAVVGKEFALQEESRVTLPSGEVVFPPKRRASAVIDQAFVRVHTITAPFEFALGRRNYEDERHWLYDTSMDIASVAARWGRFRIEVFGGRETWVDLDIAPGIQQVRDRNDTYVVYADYRLENARLASYLVARNDRAGLEGHPRLYGVRAIGSPSERLNYWLELAHLAGKDENRRRFEGIGFDVGATYRWTGVRHLPSITLGYAFGSGDGNPNDSMNREFRQTGIHSNETRFANIPPFQIYGETFAPELSNLKLLTVGFGFRPAPLVSVDLVYHRYRLHRIADTFRSSALTAEINQIDNRMSKDLGQAVDVVLGFRRLFGFRRLGLDLRTGWFFPGDAFLQNDGTDARPLLHKAHKGFAVVSKIWW